VLAGLRDVIEEEARERPASLGLEPRAVERIERRIVELWDEIETVDLGSERR
jgi:hypothetical protein